MKNKIAERAKKKRRAEKMAAKKAEQDEMSHPRKNRHEPSPKK